MSDGGPGGRRVAGSTPPPPLPPVVKSLGAVSFFNDLASEMMYPLIPALVTRLGGGAVSLGLLDGVSDAIAAGAKLAAGWLADHPRWRRPLVIGGYAIAAVARPVIGVAASAWQVITLRATDRVGKGIRTPPRDAVIADATPAEIRGRAFGFHRAMDHTGAVVGPLVAWALLARGGLTPGHVIAWSAVPGAIAVLAVTWAMRERSAVHREPSSGRRPAAGQPGAGGARSQSRIFALIVLFSFARFPETLLLLRLQDLRMPVALAPAIWAALHVVRTTASYPGGKASDAVGPRTTMLAGWSTYAVVCVGLGLVGSAAGGAAWFLVFGLVAALTESPERAFVAGLHGGGGGGAGSGRRFGVYHAAVGAAALLGGIAFGAVYARAGGPAALMASGALAGGLALMLLLWANDADAT